MRSHGRVLYTFIWIWRSIENLGLVNTFRRRKPNKEPGVIIRIEKKKPFFFVLWNNTVLQINELQNLAGEK